MNDEQKALLEETKRLHARVAVLKMLLAEIKRRGLLTPERVATDEALLAQAEQTLTRSKERLLKCLLYPAAEL